MKLSSLFKILPESLSASVISFLIWSYWGIKKRSKGRISPLALRTAIKAESYVPSFYARDVHSSSFYWAHCSRYSCVFWSALTRMLFSKRHRLCMILQHAYTDSRASNSARPNDCGLEGSVIERFQFSNGPQVFSSRSKSWFEAYLGILLTNTVFFSWDWMSGGIRVEISKPEATDFCDLTTD